jgi:hypothetical protein
MAAAVYATSATTRAPSVGVSAGQMPPLLLSRGRSPISDPVARFQNAERLKRDAMVKNHVVFVKPTRTADADDGRD